MNNKVAIHLILSFLLLTYTVMNISNHKEKYYPKTDPFILKKCIEYRDHFKITKNAALLCAMIFGQKQLVHSTHQEAHQELFLYHLLTPSGLHFSSFLLVFRFFHPPSWIILAIILFFFYIVQYGGFYELYSLKRIIHLKVLYFVFLKKKDINFYFVFYSFFIFDFFLGTYLQNPLSFCYSFLFLGVVCFSTPAITQRLISLISANILICYFSQMDFNIFIFVINFIISFLFVFFFPILLFFSLLPFHQISEWLISQYAEIIHITYELTKNFKRLEANLLIVVLMIMIHFDFFRINRLKARLKLFPHRSLAGE